MASRKESILMWYDHIVIPSFKRTLWIIGLSGSGKSSFARAVNLKLNVEIIETGKWIRAMHHPESETPELTASVCSILDKDSRFFSRKIAEEIKKFERSIVVGTRNPTDFVDSFNAKTDAVVFLGLNQFTAKTSFEKSGVDAICAFVDFLRTSDFVTHDRVVFATRI